MKRALFLVTVLVVGHGTLWGVDKIHTPSAKVVAVGQIDFQVMTQSISQTSGSLPYETKILDFSVAYAPVRSFELDGDFAVGSTYFPFRRLVNRGNLGVGFKYRPLQISYEKGEFALAIAYRAELPTNNYRSLVAHNLSRNDAAQIVLNHGRNQGIQLISSISYNRFFAGAYGEYLRHGVQDQLRLGDAQKLGGTVYYSLTNVAKTPQVALLADVWVRQFQATEENGEKMPDSGGREFIAAPGISVAVKPRIMIKASWMQPITTRIGKRDASFERGYMVGVSYRFN